MGAEEERGDEITATNLRYSLSDLSDLSLSRLQVEALYKFLTKHGLVKNIRVYHSATGKVSFTKKFTYMASSLTPRMGDDGYREGDMVLNLSAFLDSLVRLDRVRHKKFQNAIKNIGGLNRAIDAFKKEMGLM